jgi:hypothetical protein
MKTYFLTSYTTQDRKIHWNVVEQEVVPPPEVDDRPKPRPGYELEPLRAEKRERVIGAELTLEEAMELQAKAVRGEL